MNKKLILLSFVFAGFVFAGPYVEPPHTVSEIGTDPNCWATGCTVIRGYQDISDTSWGYAWYGYESNVAGVPGGNQEIVSLGDGGIATVTFDSKIFITNGPGDDFVVFENGFSINDSNDSFLELAFVEVSSDGVNYFRFTPVSLSPTNVQVDNFSGLNETDIYNLAGKHKIAVNAMSFDPNDANGTGFDLDELKTVSLLLDVNSITHVRLIDVVGFIEPADLYTDGVVDFNDFSIFTAAYGSRVGDVDWNEDCDMYRVMLQEFPPVYEEPDGKIDIYDMSIFVQAWLSENEYASFDVNGRQINDPWPTPFSTSGFDLNAIGILNKRLRD